MINRKKEMFERSMNKTLFIFILIAFFILNFIISNVFSQDDEIDRVIKETVPGAGIIDKVNPEELPNKISELKENIDAYKRGEQNKSFLMKEWTRILGNKPVIGPFMFYTDKFFSFFNPVWRIIFKIPFSWSLAFILSFGFWIVLIIMIYYPIHDIFQNNLIGLLVSIIVASLIGIAGSIFRVVEFSKSLIENIYALIILILVILLIVSLYIILMKKFKKESEELKLKTSEEKIKTLGDISGEGLKEMSK